MIAQPLPDIGYPLSGLARLILETFAVESSPKLEEIHAKVNGVGFYRELGGHPFKKSTVRCHLETMEEWQLIHRHRGRYQLTDQGVNQLLRHHPDFWKKFVARQNNQLCFDCGNIMLTLMADCPYCAMKDIQREEGIIR